MTAAAAVVTGVVTAQPAAAAAETTVSVAPGQGKSVSLQTGPNDKGSATFTLPSLPRAGASLYLGSRVRVASSASYALQARVQSTGVVTVSVKRKDASGRTADLVRSTATGITLTAGARLSIDLSASGSSPVSLAGSVSDLATGKRHDLKVADASPVRLATTAAADAWVYGSSNAKSTISAQVSDGTAPTPPAAAPASVGVPAGTALKVHEGDFIIDKPNTVISGLEIRGFVRVNAPGAIIENSRILGRQTTNAVAIVSNYNNGNPFTIRNSEVYAATPTPYLNGIMGHNFTASNVWVHGVIDSVRITGDNVTVENSLLENNLHYTVDPTQGNTPSHDDSIQIQGGSHIRIVGNRISGAFNAAVQITQGLGRVSDVRITGNYLDGGGCTVNIAETGKGSIAGTVLESNIFGPNRRVANCGVVAASSSYPQMLGNSWESTGKDVGVMRG